MTKKGELYVSQRSAIPYVIQFVARDLTALNSDVIAVWKGEDESFDIADRAPDLFLHTTVLTGVKLGFWKKYGKQEPVDCSRVLFKQPDIDFLADVIEQDSEAQRWNTWYIGGEWMPRQENLYHDQSVYPGAVYAPAIVNYYLEKGEFPPDDYYDSLQAGRDY